jgi:hypothetical protein
MESDTLTIKVHAKGSSLVHQISATCSSGGCKKKNTWTLTVPTKSDKVFVQQECQDCGSNILLSYPNTLTFLPTEVSRYDSSHDEATQDSGSEEVPYSDKQNVIVIPSDAPPFLCTATSAEVKERFFDGQCRSGIALDTTKSMNLGVSDFSLSLTSKDLRSSTDKPNRVALKIIRAIKGQYVEPGFVVGTVLMYCDDAGGMTPTIWKQIQAYCKQHPRGM